MQKIKNFLFSLKFKFGFTLIELLISFGLTATLFTFVLSIYFQVQEVVISESESVSESNVGLNTVNVISRDLNNIFIEPATQKKLQNMEPLFAGIRFISNGERVDALSFVANRLYVNNLVLQSRVYNVTYYCEYDDITSNFTLFRRESAFVNYKNPLDGISIPLLKNVRVLKFEFSLNGQKWIDEWTYKHKKKFPRYIRVHLEWEKIPGLDDSENRNVITRIITPTMLNF